MEEIFENIKGFGGLYQATNLGRIFSLSKKGKGGHYGKFLKYGSCKKGYLSVSLSKNKKSKSFKVHRLVAQAFLGLDISNTKIQVCHKDDNPGNNNKDNLFLGTNKDNVKDMINKGRGAMQGKFGKNHNCSKKVIQYDLKGNIIKIWNSLMDVERKLGIRNQNISTCCRGGLKTSGGFIWKFI